MKYFRALMRRFALGLMVLGTALFLAQGPVHAEGQGFDIIGGIGGAWSVLYPRDVQLRDYYRDGLSFKGFLEFMGENGISALGDIGYSSMGNRSASAPNGTALTMIPATASVAYHFAKDSSVSPYLGAGLGIFYIDESDPDVNYLRTARFGKTIFAGADINNFSFSYLFAFHR